MSEDLQSQAIKDVTAAFARLDAFQYRHARVAVRAARHAIGWPAMKPVLDKFRWIDRQLSREVMNLFEVNKFGAEANELLCKICAESLTSDKQPSFEMTGPMIEPAVKMLEFSDDMPEAVLGSGRLADLCRKRMLSRFPIAFAWPAVLAAASPMVPSAPSDPNIVTVGDDLVTSLTALVGPVNCGKSQAIAHARALIGLPRELESEVKAGSAESLFRLLMASKKRGTLMPSLLIDVDEFAHFMKKGSIDNASMFPAFQSMFYKRHIEATLSGGFHVDLNCAITLIGGIVEDQFDELFGNESTGGLRDRFTFGLCPAGFEFLYEPFSGCRESFSPVVTRIDKDVYEMANAFKKKMGCGRVIELAIRAAHIAASCSGQTVLRAAECQDAIIAFTEYQMGVRKTLLPNEGLTNDAKMEIAIMNWLEKHAAKGELVPESLLHNALRKRIGNLGFGIVKFARNNLMAEGYIGYGPHPDGREYKCRKIMFYQLHRKRDE